MTTFRGRWNTWHYRFWWRHRKYERAGFATRHAADVAEQEQKRAVGYGTRHSVESIGDIALTVYATQWLEAMTGELAPATLASYRERLTTHVLPTLGRRALRDLTPREIRDVLRAKRSQGHARNSVRLMRAALSALLSAAVDDGLIAANPALHVGRRGTRRADRLSASDFHARVRPLSRELRDVVLTTAQLVAPQYALLFEVLAKTGIRPSEAYAICGSDIDLDRQCLRIERAWVLGHTKGTKTDVGRTVALTGGLMKRLHASAETPSALVFRTTAGRPLDKSRVRKVFRRVLREVRLQELQAQGLTDRLAHQALRREGWRPGHRLYDLRHTYASLRLAAGAPITYVAAELGHATPVTTLRYYARWIPSEGRQWVEDDR